ncbi:hypothetical protein M3Y97_00167000 [Aphelenchoides bicaudatus]|nr:hypothetical protein M3Y97_00167000 [Aphelenchoides bicaudatus]
MNSKYKCRRFEGKVVLITGGTQGIGFAVCDRLAHEGASVVLSSRNEKNVADAVEALIQSGIPRERLLGVKCHVQKPEDRQNLVQAAIKHFSRIDVLINNAGVNPAVGEIIDVTQSQYEKIFDVNVKAPFLLTKLVLPHMNPGGVVVFNSSISAYRTSPGVTTYGLSKTALLALVKTLSAELGPKGIRVNSVVPGQIKTRMSQLMWDPKNPRNEKVRDSAKSSLGLWGELGRVEEVAGSIAYLASDDAAYVTGENHLVVGGVDCRL